MLSPTESNRRQPDELSLALIREGWIRPAWRTKASATRAIPPQAVSGNPAFAERGIPLVHQISVAQDYQRRGIATALMDAAEQLALGRGRNTMGINVGLFDEYGPVQRRSRSARSRQLPHNSCHRSRKKLPQPRFAQTRRIQIRIRCVYSPDGNFS